MTTSEGRVAALHPPLAGKVLLLLIDSAVYQQSVQQILADMPRGFDHTLFVAANRPYGTLRERSIVDLGRDDISIVDCVSALTGLPPPSTRQVQYVESPTLLEKIAMRAEKMLSSRSGRRLVIVDSLSTLALYNDADALAEWAHGLVNRMRLLGAAVVLLLVPQQAPPGLADRLAPLCDDVVRTSSV